MRVESGAGRRNTFSSHLSPKHNIKKSKNCIRKILSTSLTIQSFKRTLTSFSILVSPKLNRFSILHCVQNLSILFCQPFNTKSLIMRAFSEITIPTLLKVFNHLLLHVKKRQFNKLKKQRYEVLSSLRYFYLSIQSLRLSIQTKTGY